MFLIKKQLIGGTLNEPVSKERKDIGQIFDIWFDWWVLFQYLVYFKN
jgi:hypothetical protein